jgi:hypothetical protein
MVCSALPFILRMHGGTRRVQIVHDFTCFSTEKMPRDVARHYQFHKGLKYTPAVSIDEFQVRNDQIASLAGAKDTREVGNAVNARLARGTSDSSGC